MPYRTMELKPANREKKISVFRFSEYHFEKYLTFAQPSGAVLAAGVGVGPALAVPPAVPRLRRRALPAAEPTAVRRARGPPGPPGPAAVHGRAHGDARLPVGRRALAPGAAVGGRRVVAAAGAAAGAAAALRVALGPGAPLAPLTGD